MKNLHLIIGASLGMVAFYFFPLMPSFLPDITYTSTSVHWFSGSEFLHSLKDLFLLEFVGGAVGFLIMAITGGID